MSMSSGPVRADPLLGHAAWLQRLASRLVAAHAAEDVVQDTWLAALRRPPDAGRPARPWLAAVLRNFVRMRARAAAYDAERSQRAGTDAASAPALPTPETLLERHELLRMIAALVSALDEPYRTTVLLWSEEGLTLSEIARRQGVPVATVRWRLKEGLERIRRGLDG